MDKSEIKVKLLAETAKIRWQELEKFFARGVLLRVSDQQDLVEIATLMACDDSKQIAELMTSQQLEKVDVERAKQWSADEFDLWAVVVSPWVLVQQR